jgi:hypothetical protein
MSLKYAAALSMVAMLTAGAAYADSNTADHFAATLTGPGGATGKFRAEYYPPEMTLAFGLTYSGLDNPTKAEFVGADGKPIIEVKASPKFIGGSSWLESLTDQQRSDLVAGKWTFKVDGPNGALTGPVTPVALVGQTQ